MDDCYVFYRCNDRYLYPTVGVGDFIVGGRMLHVDFNSFFGT